VSCKGFFFQFPGEIPPNPAGLLVSDRFSEAIRELSGDYDYIFIDTPPVNVVADASIISRHLEGFVFVVQQGSSERDSVKNALEQLKLIKAEVLGFLLNSASHSGKS
jgi:capsular exopolysaccharide synthesis family protein